MYAYLCSFNFFCESFLQCMVHTNQKRFQCESPREKRAVLRQRKEALGSPVNKVDCVEEISWFQSAGPMIAKAREGALVPVVLVCGTKRSCRSSHHNGQRETAGEGKQIRLHKYLIGPATRKIRPPVV